MDKNELDIMVSKLRSAQDSLSSYNDEHAIGMANGLELAIALLTNGEPHFKFYNGNIIDIPCEKNVPELDIMEIKEKK